MEKTPFVGLTVLGPEDSLNADNSAFVTRDRDAIDSGLKIGIKTHRHDGSAGLSNPAIAPSGLIIGSGGSIPAGISITLGYSIQDSSGGETLISPTAILTTPSPITVPSTAPTATASYLAGELDVDTFTYAATWIDGDGGETPIGPSVTVTRDPGFANAEVELVGLTTGMAEAGAVAWRLYRARAGGEYVRLAEGATDTYTDDGSDAAECDLHPPTFNTNTTGGTNQLQFMIPASFGAGTGSAQSINLYASQAGDFAEACLLAQVPVGSAGAKPIFASLELLDAQPPDVNRSYGGANKIDPDTELIDWHWKRPVTGSAALSSGAVGDVKLTEDRGILFAVLGSAGAATAKDWTPIGTMTIQGSAVSLPGINTIEFPEAIVTGSGVGKAVVKGLKGASGSNGAEGLQGQFFWTYETNHTMSSAPASGRFKMNSENPGAVTQISFNHKDGYGAKEKAMLQALASGKYLVIRKRSAPGSNVIFKITSGPTEIGGESQRFEVEFKEENSGSWSGEADAAVSIL